MPAMPLSLDNHDSVAWSDKCNTKKPAAPTGFFTFKQLTQQSVIPV